MNFLNSLDPISSHPSQGPAMNPVAPRYQTGGGYGQSGMHYGGTGAAMGQQNARKEAAKQKVAGKKSGNGGAPTFGAFSALDPIAQQQSKNVFSVRAEGTQKQATKSVRANLSLWHS